VKAQGAKFDGGYSMFDLPEADKCLLAYGELDVRCSFLLQQPTKLTKPKRATRNP
jgi:hypothetical protein